MACGGAFLFFSCFLTLGCVEILYRALNFWVECGLSKTAVKIVKKRLLLLFKSEVLNMGRPAVFRYCADDLLRKPIRGLHIDLQGNFYLCPVCCGEVGYDFFNEPLHISTNTSGVQWYAHVEPLVFRLLNRRGWSWLRLPATNLLCAALASSIDASAFPLLF